MELVNLRVLELKGFLPPKYPTFFQLMMVFCVFLLIHLVFIPLLFLTVYYVKTGLVIDLQDPSLSVAVRGWWNVAMMVSSSLGVLLFSAFFLPETNHAVWSRRPKSPMGHLRSFFWGAISFFLCYVLVFVLQKALLWVRYQVFGDVVIDQEAVKSLKSTMLYPSLMWMTVLSMVVFVPILEELLFRGYLQSFLRRMTSAKVAIGLSSIVFSLFHFSFAQGASNLELLGALFALSCFLSR